ncbi:MAG TPA: hypothetical protein VGC56_06935 [Allosphingosinicella sp.]|jgi:hypothetical protein
MPFMMLIAAIVGGLIAVGVLLLLQSVVQASHPGWTLPFSAWSGLLLSVPALFAALLQGLQGIGRRTP